VQRNAYVITQAKSCFCFSAINPSAHQTADLNRISFLELETDTGEGKEERYTKFLTAVRDTLTPEYSSRLLGRTVENFMTLKANAKTFSLVASELFGSKRAGDQLGHLIAGAFSLTSTKEIPFEDAREWVKSHDWDWHLSSVSDSDAKKVLEKIMSSRITYDQLGMRKEQTVFDMVSAVYEEADDVVTLESIKRGLRNSGIKIMGQWLAIANKSDVLRIMLRDTPYSDWGRTLKDFEGATAHKHAVDFGGFDSRVTLIPIRAVIRSSEPQMEGDVF
jgi:putative DNA primase/helicase